MRTDELTRLKAGIEVGDPDALHDAFDVTDPDELAALVPSYLKGIERLQRDGEREYGVALYNLAQIARRIPVSPLPFLAAIELYPNSNESEGALGALKSILPQLARANDRAMFARVCTTLEEAGLLQYLQPTIASLEWPDQATTPGA